MEAFMKKQLLVAGALLLAAAGMVFANGGQESKSAASASASGSSSKPVTLEVIWFNDANESQVMQDTMKDWLAAHPNVKLDVQLVAYQNYDQKLKMMLSGGDIPDVVRLSTGSIVQFTNQLLPLKQYLPNLDMSQFVDASLVYCKNSQDQYVAFPSDATANGMIVNKTAFQKAGIDVDKVSQNWTWDDFQKYSAQVVKANPNVKYGLAVDYTLHRFSTIVYQMGGHLLKDDYSGFNFENPGTINAIKLFKTMTDNGTIAPSVWQGSEAATELFQSGVVAANIGGSWCINSNIKAIKDFEWEAVRCPKGVTRSSVFGGKFVAGFKGCKNPQVAAEFMQAFTDKAHTEAYCLGTFNMSPRKDTKVAYPQHAQDFATMSQDLAATPSYTAHEWMNAAIPKNQKFAQSEIAEVLQGHETAEQAAKKIDANGAQYFAK
jgi:alpha-1,4-digalacturonate transport system substrate-binding protein